MLDYDANLRTAIFKCDDEYGTEKPLPGKTSETDNALAGMAVETSPITRYKISYDDKGRFSKIEYATFQNVDVTDDDMIHGMTFEYDDRDRMTKKTTIGLEGRPRAIPTTTLTAPPRAMVPEWPWSDTSMTATATP